jgi:homocysteine S-methyltransferase
MINCAHSSHFQHILEPGATWLDRIGGIRPNASRKSHAELDESTGLDSGNPDELGRQYEDLAKYFSNRPFSEAVVELIAATSMRSPHPC